MSHLPSRGGSGPLASHYSEIYAVDASATVTIAGTGEANKVQITAFDTNGPTNATAPDHTNDHITITTPGNYLVVCSISADSVSGSAAVFGFAIYKNNGATKFPNLHSERYFAAGGSRKGSISISGIAYLAANDTIEAWVWNVDNTNNIVIDDITLSLSCVGT